MKALELGGKGVFVKSDIGPQSAWKGFSSQSLYIASRIRSITSSDYALGWILDFLGP